MRQKVGEIMGSGTGILQNRVRLKMIDPFHNLVNLPTAMFHGLKGLEPQPCIPPQTDSGFCIYLVFFFFFEDSAFFGAWKVALSFF